MKPKTYMRIGTYRKLRAITLCVLFFVISMFMVYVFICLSQGLRRIVTPCPGMTKWEGANCELYIFEAPNTDPNVYNPPPGILVYRDKNKKEYIYDVYFSYFYISLYEHRENPDDVVNEVASYNLKDVSTNEEEVKFSLRNNYEENCYFPEILKLKITEENLNIEDIPYKYCYGNPIFVIGSKKFSFSWGNDSFYLFIFDDNKTGTLTWKARETGEETKYNVTFDSNQIMTVYDKCTDEKIVSYYIYCQSNDEFYAIMKEKFDENCTWKEYMVFS